MARSKSIHEALAATEAQRWQTLRAPPAFEERAKVFLDVLGKMREGAKQPVDPTWADVARIGAACRRAITTAIEMGALSQEQADRMARRLL